MQNSKVSTADEINGRDNPDWNRTVECVGGRAFACQQASRLLTSFHDKRTVQRHFARIFQRLLAALEGN